MKSFSINGYGPILQECGLAKSRKDAEYVARIAGFIRPDIAIAIMRYESSCESEILVPFGIPTFLRPEKGETHVFVLNQKLYLN